MNISTNTNQINETTKTTARTTPVGFRRRTIAGALLIMALTGTAVGLAANSHADDGAPPPPAVVLPLPPAPPWVGGLIDLALHPHFHCGVQSDGRYRCGWS